MRWSDLAPGHRLGLRAWLCSFLLLLLPGAILGLLAYRTGSKPVLVGAGVQAMFLLVFFRAHPVWRPPVSISVVVLYLIALVWAWLPLRNSPDWAPHLAQGLLLLGAVTLLAVHDLKRTGAEPLRRANKWARRIAARAEWPMQLADCRVIPEAQQLRDAIRDEPGPALALLSDPRAEVQTAALGALEHRPHWRPGEAELVLKLCRDHPEAAVRAAAAYALAGVDTPELIAGLAGFLRDYAPEVRRAASESLMWDADARWPFARDAVREALADVRLSDDGPLFAGIGRLPGAAVADLISWSSEHPPVATRAILTLCEHYHAELLAADRPELANELATMMLDNETSPALRVELAALLREHHMLSPDLLDRLTNLDQPAPMRLFAAELMLQINPHDPDGVDVLRGLARQPNRELAVRVGAVLQNVLGLEVGLTPGELPAPNSKQAADVARRVLAWANGAPPEVLRPTPGPRPGLKGSRPKASGIGGSRQGIPGAVATPPAAPGVGSRPGLPAIPTTATPAPAERPKPPPLPLPEPRLPGGPVGDDSVLADPSVLPPANPVLPGGPVGDDSVLADPSLMPPSSLPLPGGPVGDSVLTDPSMLPKDLPPLPPKPKRPGSNSSVVM